MPLHFAHAPIHDDGIPRPYSDPQDRLPTCDNSSLGFSYLPLAAIFRERELPSGCHSASDITATFMRALNIPAIRGYFFDPTHTANSNHGIVWLPNLGLFSHGDWLAYNNAGTSGELLLLNWDDFVSAVTDFDDTSHFAYSHFMTTGLHMTNQDRLYVTGISATVPDYQLLPGFYYEQGFDGDIDNPFPQTLRMLRTIQQVYPSARFVPDPSPELIELTSDPVPALSFEQERQMACQ
jgi:hypothetical protein